MTDLPAVDEITVCTACWCSTKGVVHGSDVLCGKCGEYKRKADEIIDDSERADVDETPMPHSAVFGAILKKEGKDAED